MVASISSSRHIVSRISIHFHRRSRTPSSLPRRFAVASSSPFPPAARPPVLPVFSTFPRPTRRSVNPPSEDSVKVKRGQRDTGYWRGLAYFTGCPAIRPLCTAHCTPLHTRARATRKVESYGNGGGAGGRGRDDRGSKRGKGEQAERGRGWWNKRRGRSESDRETERLFNGVELVIGALRVHTRRWKGTGRREGGASSARGGHTSSWIRYIHPKVSR